MPWTFSFTFCLLPLILNYDFLGELLQSSSFPQCPVCLTVYLYLRGWPSDHPRCTVSVAHSASPYESFQPELTNFLVSCSLI